MKKFGKILSLVLALVLVVGVFSACGGDKEVKTGGKYTYWVTFGGAAAQTLSSYSELLMYQEMAKATGTEVDFIHPASGSTGTEAFQILLSSGDYPDMIEYSWASYTGGPDQAINDGVIIAINDYMKDYAPNYYDYMEGEKGAANGGLYRASSITESGNYYGFRNLCIGNLRNFGGIYIRKDLLDDWGLEVPVTLDDWDKVLKTAKENGVKYPITASKDLFEIGGGADFNAPWKVSKGWCIMDGEVKFGPFESAYKDYVAKMAEWMKAGYIDPDYITNDSNGVFGYITNGTSIASVGYVGSSLGHLLPAMEEKDPDFSVVACPIPVMNAGDQQIFSYAPSAEALDPTIAITVQCGADNPDRYKEAIKWCDYLYSEEGNLLKCFGVEGDTYTVEKDENGETHYVYTDRIFDHEKIGAHSVEAALYHFFRPANSPGLNQHPDYLNGFYPYEEQKEAIIKWNETTEISRDYTFPGVTYTGEEATEKAQIEAKGRDNLNAAIANIILGKASVDTFDKVVEQAKKDGYDKLLEINQAAYDRYMKVVEAGK